MKLISKFTDKEITGRTNLSEVKPRIAVNAVLFDGEGNIALATEKSNSLHTLPGGGVETGEDLTTALHREILEETGCRCEITGELGIIEENRFEHDFTQIRYYYFAQVKGEKGELRLTEEEKSLEADVVWVSVEEAFKLISEKQHNSYQWKFMQKRDIAVLSEAIIWLYFRDIPIDVKSVTPINIGISRDKKYRIKSNCGYQYLIRLTYISEYDRKKAEFDRMTLISKNGVPMPKPLGFGVCGGNRYVYQLLSWCGGENLEDILPKMTAGEQYKAGYRSGEILRKVHNIPFIDDSFQSWENKYNNFIEQSIESFKNSGVKIDNADILLNYFNDNKHLLSTRPLCYAHGDYHTGNMLYNKGKITVIDWEIHLFDCITDPWYDLCMYYTNPQFTSGMYNGYFNGDPPHEFWRINALYSVIGVLSAVSWAYYCYPPELEAKIKNCKKVFNWYDNMKNTIPKWYIKK